jgi:hypothetical protein
MMDIAEVIPKLPDRNTPIKREESMGEEFRNYINDNYRQIMAASNGLCPITIITEMIDVLNMMSGCYHMENTDIRQRVAEQYLGRLNADKLLYFVGQIYAFQNTDPPQFLENEHRSLIVEEENTQDNSITARQIVETHGIMDAIEVQELANIFG